VDIKSWIGGLLGKESRGPLTPEPLNLVNTKEEEGFPLRVTFSSSNASLLSGNWEVDKEQYDLSEMMKKERFHFLGFSRMGLKL